MQSFADLIQQGAGTAYLFIPSAILLGALHGLEPGHSKTMMAAFIVAVRGTVLQAFLLGLAATISHTAVVWGIALTGMYFYRGIDAEATEPYFQLFSALIIIALALWMLWRTWEDQQRAKAAAAHDLGHSHDHAHGHDHPSNVRLIDTGHGLHKLELHEQVQGSRWRFSPERGKPWSAEEVVITTETPDGKKAAFTFTDRGGFIESKEAVPAPYDFMARVQLGHGNHSHDFDVSFLTSVEGHDHMHEEMRGLQVGTDGYQDAHELAHANDIRRRFADRNVTTWQIVLFGLTGGLIPCPAAVTVLLLCLQLKEFALGTLLVLCFSIGLAITLVTVGVVAALGARHASKRFPWLSTVARKAPYVSGLLIIAVGLYIGWHGWEGLQSQAAMSPPAATTLG